MFMEGWFNKLLFVLHIGNPPATGTGTLHITLEDVNDNVPSLYPTLAKVCDDAKDLRVVVLGASDKDLHPNTDPFKFELSKQSGPEKLWRINKLNSKYFYFSCVYSSCLCIPLYPHWGCLLQQNSIAGMHRCYRCSWGCTLLPLLQ